MTVRGLQAERNKIPLPIARAQKKKRKKKNEEKKQTQNSRGCLREWQQGEWEGGMDMTELVRGLKLEATDIPHAPHVYQRKSEKKKKIRLRNKFPYCQHVHI